MNWKGWLAVGLGLVLLWGVLSLFQRQHSRWLVKDAERVVKIEQLTTEAKLAKERADKARAEAAEAQAKVGVLDAALRASKAKLAKRPRPQTLPEAEDEIVELKGHVDLLEKRLVVEKLTTVNLSLALEEETNRADQLEQAWQYERKRTEAYRKITKRDKVKKAFLAIGTGVVAGAAGYGIGRAM